MAPTDTLTSATAVAQGARELIQTPWDDLAHSEVVGAAEAIAVARTLLDAALLRVTDQLLSTDAVHDLGWASVPDYLTHLTGGHKGSGSGLVRIAEQLHGLPEVQTALEAGDISLPHARSIATCVQKLPRQAPEFRAQVAAALVDAIIEGGHDASAVRGKLFNEIVHALDPDGRIINLEKDRAKRERGVHSSRFLTLTEDKIGGIELKGYGTPEDAERIKAALFPLAAPVTTEPGACGGRNRTAADPWVDAQGRSTQVNCLDPHCSHDGTDPRDHRRRLWDALVDACDRLLATENLPRDHGATPRVIVTIDHHSLQQDLIDAGLAKAGVTPNGTTLSADAVRRMACDAEIIPTVLGTQSQVLDVGRAHRLVTPALWTALIARDQHCAFPTCTRPPLACDAHHIQHWADGGRTNLDNMIMLCRRHHTVVHQTPWAVTIDPHTRQPVWTPPRRQTLADHHGKFSYSIPGHPPHFGDHTDTPGTTPRHVA